MARRTVTRDNAESYIDGGDLPNGDFPLFGYFKKTSLTRISLYTVPAGTRVQTKDGVVTCAVECRIAFDADGDVYPLTEPLFRTGYEPE